MAYAEFGIEHASSICDPLSDLRHLCDALGEDFDTESARGERYYAAQIQGVF